MKAHRQRPRARRIAMVWPYLPEYRLAFCQSAYDRLASEGMTLTLHTGRPAPLQVMRQDEVTAPWHRLIAEHRIHMPRGTEAIWRTLPRDVDLLILQQAVKNLESYPALVRQHGRGPGVAFFGHGRSYSTPQGALLAAWKDSMTKRAEWAFVYTDSGAVHLADRGFPRTRITVLRNTIDVAALRRHLGSVSAEQVDAFHRRFRSRPGRTALFLGALDKAKGIDLVVDAAWEAADRLPGCVVVLAGEGPDRGAVETAIRAGAPVRLAGRVSGIDKAVALRAADVLLGPRSVGLVAVDSLASERPMILVEGAFHGPEADYLVDELNSRWLPHGSGGKEVGRSLADLLSNEGEMHRLREGCRASSPALELDGMVDRFVDGVLAWAEIRRFGL